MVIVSDSQTCEYLGHSPWSELPCVEPSSRDPRAGVGGREGKPSCPSDWGGAQRTTFKVFIKQLRCNWNLTVHNGSYLFILLFLFQSSFFLWT